MSGHELRNDPVAAPSLRVTGDGTGEAVLTSSADMRRIRAVLALGGVPYDDLDDGLQTVRLKVLEQNADPERPRVRNPATWAAVAASRVAIDWHRHHTRQRNLAERLTARQYTAPAAPDPDDRTAAMTMLAGALDELSHEQRQVVVLRFYCDLRLRDIAATLGLPTGTVKSRLHAALRLLRTHLHEIEERDDTNT